MNRQYEWTQRSISSPSQTYAHAYPDASNVFIVLETMTIRWKAEPVSTRYSPTLSFEYAEKAREIELEAFLAMQRDGRRKEDLLTSPPRQTPLVAYLNKVESHIPTTLLSSSNLFKIKQLTQYFAGDLTSFFGFESRLTDPAARCDYLFAISAKRGEREAFKHLIDHDLLPEAFLQQQEWKHVISFIKTWSDPASVLYNNVLGLWFEFDTADEESSGILTPNVFLHTIPLRIDSQHDIKKCQWFLQHAFPALTGHALSKTMKERFIASLKELPPGASLFHVGTMLSRATSGLRLVINRMQPCDIVPYLKRLGWSDGSDDLHELITELEKHVDRIVLNFDITEQGVGPKIGIECSYYPRKHDTYEPETRWGAFLDYLVEKGLCLPEKKEALLDYLGLDHEQGFSGGIMNPLILAAKIPDNERKETLVRQIGHIKIVHNHDHSLEAKAYFGGRLYGVPETSHQTTMKK